MALLLGIELLLVGFSIGAVLLDQTALAAMAGTASITLAGDIVRRILSTAPERDGRAGHPESTEVTTPPEP
ncbi:hypothetical protein O7621_21385 [Solwaraspora sp. WMMD937]|uniref:hypothetical protein n=1 Tax=Solwaraspora sp. WMMD937 TaxID=3016090 RepID=UPI00249A1F62|nr:hypothetical protein [Solwaraspora sp. WMMD937]WFE20432.1 hypothetical protein O7621_21385 [Solwaraspora sp. WMMD937]